MAHIDQLSIHHVTPEEVSVVRTVFQSFETVEIVIGNFKLTLFVDDRNGADVVSALTNCTVDKETV